MSSKSIWATSIRLSSRDFVNALFCAKCQTSDCQCQCVDGDMVCRSDVLRSSRYCGFLRFFARPGPPPIAQPGVQRGSAGGETVFLYHLQRRTRIPTET